MHSPLGRPLVLAVAVLLAAPSPRRPPLAPSLDRAAILDSLGAVLRARNPRIERTAFLEIRAFDYGRKYAAVGWGVRGDLRFSGSFEDELFGVFVLDSSLTRITAVLDLFATPRWRDFDLGIDHLTGDSVVVSGRGATYGDVRIRRSYEWAR